MKKYYLLAILPALLPPLYFWSESDAPINVVQHPPQFKVQTALLADQAKAQILEHNLWDKARGKIAPHVAEIKVEPPKPIEWQLKAVQPPFLAIIKSADAFKNYHPGDKLPDGALLQQVLLDGIIFKREQTIETRYLFGKKSKTSL
jgi:hypothetical protein